jgi:hypothetical protein
MLSFGAGVLYGIQLTDAAGVAVSNPTPVQFGVIQDIQGDLSFEEKMLYGANQFPVAYGRGKGKLEFKAKFANINGQIMGDLFLGNGSNAGIKGVVNNLAAAVPGVSAYTITPTPPSSGTVVTDLGVTNATTGVPLKKVASGPTTGQYSYSAGVWTFAAADASMAVLISYEYTASSTTAKYGNFSNQLMGYAPAFGCRLSVPYNGKQLTLSLTTCYSSKLSLPFKNDDFAIPDFGFQAIADASGSMGYWATSD